MVSENHGKKSILNKNSPFFFALSLCVSTREQLMAAACEKSVCGLRYRGSRVRTKNSNLIEKKVSE
jgi:hypothetical protein